MSGKTIKTVQRPKISSQPDKQQYYETLSTYNRFQRTPEVDKCSISGWYNAGQREKKGARL